ncbi:phosphotriesterase-related protein [Rhodococcus rhodochrous J3]|uniref:Phosphotriesterase-related protein n=1 Tax=Rhodococcus rhodochrous J3 TaxID=903528 RepID=A0ABY1MGF0_RHORH|nr:MULTISPECIES: aryldialkylphosphatase [Rhodococcus]AYA26582.1 phosphotriesterase [Rhodococcus rhodochrous]MBF4476573.1 phosphotriesterase [Rhodococcus rhodochrous]MDC3726779.1 phosphotriesterase [Rhodococcus sp. Rp3]SMG55007.1 phosphotriesterase-related protein [Rhodococcus rhodochrous J3]
MSRVNTVLGPIAPEELGIVAVHEHIGYGMPGSELDTRWWKSPEVRYEETVPKLRKFHEYGGGTFVDVTGICNGRDIDYYKSLSAKTGVHIVACTGFVGGDTALPFFERASVDYLMRQFVHEITVGIGDTGSRAGVIKVGVSRGGKMTELDKRIYRAAARAALATGVPILTHLAIDAENAIAIFTEEGLPLHRVLFGHADDGVNAEKTRDTWIAQQGGRVGFDTFGYETELEDPPFWARPRKERLAHFLRFLNAGHLDQALAGVDANCSPLGWPGVKGHTVNYLFEDLIPDLREAGLDEATITKLFVENPADFLTIAQP